MNFAWRAIATEKEIINQNLSDVLENDADIDLNDTDIERNNRLSLSIGCIILSELHAGIYFGCWTRDLTMAVVTWSIWVMAMVTTTLLVTAVADYFNCYNRLSNLHFRG